VLAELDELVDEHDEPDDELRVDPQPKQPSHPTKLKLM
jgi:hypothetical protein